MNVQVLARFEIYLFSNNYGRCFKQYGLVLRKLLLVESMGTPRIYIDSIFFTISFVVEIAVS
jgi:hypothetical protein